MIVAGYRVRPTTLVALGLLLFGSVALLRPDPSASVPEEEPCDVETDPLCVPEGSVTGSRAAVLRADSVCRNDSGYLCVGLEEQDRIQIRRWKDFSGTIIVHVPRPPGEPGGRAQRLQAAVAAGLRAWNGQPFPIAIDERGTREPHFEVRWRRSLSGSTIGSARTRWSEEGGIEVRQIDIVTHSPFDRTQPIDTESIRLVAAHEMGHALGILHHSDSNRDVMYPSNTASALTARDYRTMDALYSLPNGAFVVR